MLLSALIGLFAISFLTSFAPGPRLTLKKDVASIPFIVVALLLLREVVGSQAQLPFKDKPDGNDSSQFFIGTIMYSGTNFAKSYKTDLFKKRRQTKKPMQNCNGFNYFTGMYYICLSTSPTYI